jgi:CheY-like chemotaxis protein
VPGPAKPLKKVLDVGQCQPDHASIRRLVEGQFSAQVVQAHSAHDALEQLRGSQFDLVLVNRKLDADYSDGLEIIRQIKADPQLATLPVMLITNYSEHQQEAIAAGAEAGFGKSQLSDPATHERLEKWLSG